LEAGARRDQGARLAAHLAGSWRDDPVPTEFTEPQLSSIESLLIVSGGAGLAWRRLRHSSLADSAAGRNLHDVYRRQALQEPLHQQSIALAASRLNAVGIRPVLVKGWAISRQYPERGLRPRGDIDFCVEPERHAAAAEALDAADFRGLVDCHAGVDRFAARRAEEMLARSTVVAIGNAQLRVLSPEDHLRLLCVHLLRHSAWRALWLCDVALLVESRRGDFDWEYCLGGGRRERDRVACTLALARVLLGASIDDTPVAARAKNLPTWLVPAVLDQWGATPHFRNRMGSFFVSPGSLLREIPRRLPNPIEASISLNAPFNNAPRLPLQIADTLRRSLMFAVNLPEHLTAQRRARQSRREQA
jgi:hypothetical protein